MQAWLDTSHMFPHTNDQEMKLSAMNSLVQACFFGLFTGGFYYTDEETQCIFWCDHYARRQTWERDFAARISARHLYYPRHLRLNVLLPKAAI
jgi:hypothetical protein